MRDEDDWDGEDDSPPQEEPHCPPCGDSRYIEPSRLAKLLQIKTRPCPSCNPTRTDRAVGTIRWRLRQARTLLHLHRRPSGDDEAPF